MHESGTAGAIYGLGFIGAAVYFIGGATTVWMGWRERIIAAFNDWDKQQIFEPLCYTPP